MSVTSTENAASLLTPVTRSGRKRRNDMPYAPGFTRALHGIASGDFEPKSKSLQKITPRKAKQMLAEAQGRHKGQLKAVRQVTEEK